MKINGFPIVYLHPADILLIAVLLIANLALSAGIAIGLARMADKSQPVCHSITEDSVITDCDYRNGAWYRK